MGAGQNGVVASLREYRGYEGVVRRRQDPPGADCYYCAVVRSQGDAADVKRYCHSHVR
jgi:hypothetical protein